MATIRELIGQISPDQADSIGRKDPSILCPISQDIMIEPVMDKQGVSYDRSQVEAWLAKSETSPMTRQPLTKRDLVPNLALTRKIMQLLRDVIQASRKPPMRILVQSTTGRYISLTVEPTESIRSVKMKLQVKEGVPPDQQRLSYGGRDLQDSERGKELTLQDYKVPPDATLHLIFRLRGG